MTSQSLRRMWLVLLLVGAASAEQGAKYLVLAADNYTGILQPLANWKTKKGVLAKIVPISQVGATPSQIQTYIRAAYNTWPVRPEYVLLAGAPGSIPSYNGITDCYYGNMAGDYVMEISVGRFFANTARECSTMVNKVLAYEKPADGTDTTWFLKGTTCVREDNGPDDTLYWGDSRMLHGYWRGCGYSTIDSFSMNRGNTSADVTSSANSGRTFITYRGQGVGTWWSPFNSIDPFSWTNGAKLPVAVGATCATVVLESSGSMYGDKFVRAGSPAGLGGAIAYFGTTGSLSHGAHYRSACVRGFAKALFEEKLNRLGPATLRGRWRCDSLYHVQARYDEWCLLGDPELNLWTGMPRRIEVEYDSVIVLGPQEYVVTVRSAGSPVSGAQVCAWMDTAVYEVGLTDGAGRVQLGIDPDQVGTMALTVTGPNLRPFEGTCLVTAGSAPYMVVAGTEVDDFAGNQDGQLNPGEQARLHASLRNIGRVGAHAVQGLLRVAGSGVAVLDSTATYGDIPSDSVRRGDAYELAIDTTVAEGFQVPALLRVTDAAMDSWNLTLSLVVRAGRIAVAAAVLADSAPGGNGNGRLGRGESGRLFISLTNSGGGALTGTSCVLQRLDTGVVLLDSSAHYSILVPGQTRDGRFDWFAVSAGPGLPKVQPVRFRLRYLAEGGTYRLRDSATVEVQAEEGLLNDPTGPDPYGYWCYDDTDTASGRAPVYEWLELAPPGPGQYVAGVSDSDACTRTLTLPFQFRMYGIGDNFVSVNSNGWLCLGYSGYRSGYNRAIPDTSGPGLMVDPFWDDLNPDESRNGYGTAYQYHDTTRHRWIVEYKDFAHLGQPSIRETFQAVLLDPAHYPTPTGDGDILLYYNRVSLSSGSTVGIEDNTETRGIQYLYNNAYAPTASWLQAGRALRFTTLPPGNSLSPWLVPVAVDVSDSLYGNGNGLFEAGETLEVVVTLLNRGGADALGTAGVLRNLDADAVVLDSAASFGSIVPGGTAANSGHPFVVAVAPVPAESLVDFRLALTAGTYSTACYFTIALDGVTGIAGPKPAAPRTGLGRIGPNPMTRSGRVSYSLARAAIIDLALYDATGRRAVTIARGHARPGSYSASVPAAGLPAGVYFCRLAVTGGALSERFTQKVQLAR